MRYFVLVAFLIGPLIGLLVAEDDHVLGPADGGLLDAIDLEVTLANRAFDMDQ